jgi:hypothetical protein
MGTKKTYSVFSEDAQGAGKSYKTKWVRFFGTPCIYSILTNNLFVFCSKFYDILKQNRESVSKVTKFSWGLSLVCVFYPP